MTNIEKARINKRYLIELRGGKCHDCGGVFPTYCFHFDHRDVNDKVFNLSDRMYWDFARIKEEFEKCDMVCANCHAIRTFTSKAMREKQSRHQTGIKFSRKTCKERSEKRKGFVLSDETKRKISESHKGIITRPVGWHHSAESKDKIRIKALSRPRRTGWHHSPETIEKLRQASLAYYAKQVIQ